MFYKELTDIISTTDSCIAFLRERGVLRALPPICPECNERAVEEKDRSKGDKRAWRCRSHRNFTKTVRYGSFLENSHLQLRDFIMLTHLWSSNGTVKMAGEYLHLSKKTIIVWFKLYRDICSKWMAANQPIIGGVGHIVQVDEAVISRAKYHRGRRVRERWVFGGYDTTTKVGFLHEVADRSADSLLPLIQRYALPGSEIHTDCWASYRRIAHIAVHPPYRHLTVHHSTNFVDPITHACTNSVEGRWKHVKRKLGAVNGSSTELLSWYLDEYMWRERYG